MGAWVCAKSYVIKPIPYPIAGRTCAGGLRVKSKVVKPRSCVCSLHGDSNWFPVQFGAFRIHQVAGKHIAVRLNASIYNISDVIIKDSVSLTVQELFYVLVAATHNSSQSSWSFLGLTSDSRIRKPASLISSKISSGKPMYRVAISP